MALSFLEFWVKLFTWIVSSSNWDIRVFVVAGAVLQSHFSSLSSEFSDMFGQVAWIYYLATDVLPNYMLGLIITTRDEQSSSNPGSGVMILWALFVLQLSSGFGDFFNALAAADNEMWSRRAIQLATMTYAILNSYFGSSRQRNLQWPIILLFIAALIKNVERIFCNYNARLASLKESLLRQKTGSSPDLEQYWDEFEENNRVHCFNSKVQERKKSAREAFWLFESFKNLYVDLPVPHQAQEKSKVYFLHRDDAKYAFRVVGIEMSYVYQLLYSKSRMVFGKFIHFLPMICQISTLVIWSRIDKHNIRRLDVNITYALLAFAVHAEVNSFYMMIGHSYRAATGAGGSEKLIPQLNFFDINGRVTRETETGFRRQYLGVGYFLTSVFKYAGVVSMAKQHGELIYQELRERSQTVSENPGKDRRIVANYKPRMEGPSWISTKEKTYEETLLLWHIATSLCYLIEAEGEMLETESMEEESIDEPKRNCASELSKHILEGCKKLFSNPCVKISSLNARIQFGEAESNDDQDISESACQYNKEFSKLISEYMLYLLLCNPKMMPGEASMGDMRYRAALDKVKKLYPELSNWKGKKYTRLLQMVKDDQRLGEDGDLTWFASCQLAISLQEMEKDEMWKMIGKVWMDMLLDGALQCSASAHVNQLVEGGEFLTLVWILMEHLGLGKNK